MNWKIRRPNAAESTVMTANAPMAPPNTITREYDMAMMAAMKKLRMAEDTYTRKKVGKANGFCQVKWSGPLEQSVEQIRRAVTVIRRHNLVN